MVLENCAPTFNRAKRRDNNADESSDEGWHFFLLRQSSGSNASLSVRNHRQRGDSCHGKISLCPLTAAERFSMLKQCKSSYVSKICDMIVALLTTFCNNKTPNFLFLSISIFISISCFQEGLFFGPSQTKNCSGK